jgi:hypothetical protein
MRICFRGVIGEDLPNEPGMEKNPHPNVWLQVEDVCLMGLDFIWMGLSR